MQAIVERIDALLAAIGEMARRGVVVRALLGKDGAQERNRGNGVNYGCPQEPGMKGFK